MGILDTPTKPPAAIMNAVTTCRAGRRDEGFFKDEGLDIEFVTNAWNGAGHDLPIRPSRFRLRPPARLGLQRGRIDQYRCANGGS